MSRPKVVAVVGPTASGKTSLAITLAQHCSGEVVSADSRQVYRGLDIGTGKVTAEEMQGIPHHLIDIADPHTIYTAADFERDAHAAITAILTRDRTPIVAGGSFFYLELLRGRMRPAPVPPNETLRAELANHSTEELFAQLQAADPQRAATIDPHNRRRLIRSLEIIAALGKVPPATPIASPYQWCLIGLHREPEELRARFRSRITDWLARGFAEEVRQLEAGGITPSRFEELGFEYSLMRQHLAGELSETALVDTFVAQNWQYAKRQYTWLKRDPAIQWFTPDQQSAIISTVEAFLAD